MACEEANGVLTLPAPAKVNLDLAIRGRRPDGYHEIDSLMQKIELADRIRLTRRSQGIRLSCPGVDLPEDQGNLAFRAAQAFFAEVGGIGGVEIVLDKKIPVAAGLGGGSSDAATVLAGLNRLFQTGLTPADLAALAKPLGADVPFFVSDFVAARATGIGEILTQAPGMADCFMILVNPGFPVSTKWVYENLALTSGGNPYILAPGRRTMCRDLVDREGTPLFLHNDLETVTVARYPVLEDLKQGLMADGAVGALMSGSGPTVFGVFTEEKQAKASCDRLREHYENNVFLTRPILS